MSITIEALERELCVVKHYPTRTPLPPGYVVVRPDDSGHWCWLRLSDETESSVHWDHWACWRGAWAHYRAALPADGGADERYGAALDCYDAGLLSDYGGGNVEWWQDYIRAELGRAHDFYVSQWEAARAARNLTAGGAASGLDRAREALLGVAPPRAQAGGAAMTPLDKLKALVADLADTYEDVPPDGHSHYDPDCAVCQAQREAYLIAKTIASEEAVEKMARYSCLATCLRGYCMAMHSCMMGPSYEDVVIMRIALSAILEAATSSAGEE